MTSYFVLVLLCLISISNCFNNTTFSTPGFLRPISEARKRTLPPPPAGCKAPNIENAEPIRAEAMPPRAGSWTFPIYCKPGYSLIGPCRLQCRQTSGGSYEFTPPHGLYPPTCVKDYAASQFSCNYLSSTCPLVWDRTPEPGKVSIAISRIFCGHIITTAPHTRKVYGFGASLYASHTSGEMCYYKGGIKNDPCFVIKGQRMIPGAMGVDVPAITYLGNMDGFEALIGYEDPYIGKLSREIPYYLFPQDVSPSNLASNLREYREKCMKKNGRGFSRCLQATFLTSQVNGYDIIVLFGGDTIENGILDAFPMMPVKSCLGRPCCCDLNQGKK